MLRISRLLTTALVAVAVSGCGFFRVEIQQGNYITKTQVEQLEPGMTKRDVRYIMGTPLVVDPFNAKHRWDYFYAYSPNLGTDFERHRIILFFKGDKLERIAGDTSGTQLADSHQESGGTRVTSPTEAADEGILEKIFSRDERPAPQPEDSSTAEPDTGDPL